MVLLWIVLLALAQQASGETGSELPKSELYDFIEAPELGAPIVGRYVVVLKPNDGDISAATDRLVKHVQRTSIALPRRAAAAAAISSGSEDSSSSAEITNSDGANTGDSSKPQFSVLSTLQGSAVAASSSNRQESTAAGASDGPNNARGIQGLVVQTTPDLVQHIRRYQEVSAVFSDRVIGAQVGGRNCVAPHMLSRGSITSRAVSANFKWPGCITADTKLVWVAQRCQDMSRIQYVAVYAVDKSTGEVKVQNNGKECVLLPDAKQPGWSAQRFGSCGKAPIFANDLPVSVCSMESRSSSGSSRCLRPRAAGAVTAGVTLSATVTCGGKPAKRLTLTGEGCGPDNTFIQWTKATTPDGCVIVNPNINPRTFRKLSNDIFGSCGVPPGKAADTVATVLCMPASPPVSPSQPRSPTLGRNPEPSPTPPLISPEPDTPLGQDATVYSGLRLPKVPVATGEVLPAGVLRIEAATTDGVANTLGLPVAQQVIVAVIDSGVDSTHPDLTYAGGQTWITQQTSTEFDDRAANVDLYGHGTHVAGIIAAKNTGQGVVGVSPGTPIYSLKVLDSLGRGTLANLLAAVKWVASEGVQQGIRVINLSVAAYVDPTSEDYQAISDVVCGVLKEASDAGVFIAAAAGNYAASLQGYFPATCHAVAAVTALDAATNAPATFTNFLTLSDSTAEEQAHVIAAPGVGIISTIPYSKDPSGYRALSGTSQAAPHVSAIAANCLMAQACNGTTGADHLATIQFAAQARASMPGGPNSGQYGFSGDLSSVSGGKIYGNLAWSAY